MSTDIDLQYNITGTFNLRIIALNCVLMIANYTNCRSRAQRCILTNYTEKMHIFPNIASACKYERPIEKDEYGKKAEYFHANLMVCSYDISRPRQIGEEQKVKLTQ